MTEACFRAAAIEEPQTRPYMAQGACPLPFLPRLLVVYVCMTPLIPPVHRSILTPQIRTRHHADLLAPLRAEEGQGNGAKDPERAFRRCIELVRVARSLVCRHSYIY